jgi:tetratricopeptide (TPR) repeat protein
VGWLWFLGTLVPVIGLVKIGSHAIADRYTYMTFIGLYVMLAWGGAEFLNRFRLQRLFLVSAVMALILALILTARNQTTYWADSVRLFSHAVRVNPDNLTAHRNLGLVLSYQGDLERALAHFKQALRIDPTAARSYNDIGTVFLLKGRHAESMEYFASALRYQPDYPKAHHNLGLALMSQKKYREAIGHFQAALKSNPGFKLAHQNLQKATTALARN